MQYPLIFVQTIVSSTSNVCAMSSRTRFYNLYFPCSTDRQVPRASLCFHFWGGSWGSASGDAITFFSIAFPHISFCRFIFLYFSLFFSFFNDIRLDVMVGRKYLTATVGEIRTYFFPLVVRYSDANPSVRYAAALLLYLFFLL